MHKRMDVWTDGRTDSGRLVGYNGIWKANAPSHISSLRMPDSVYDNRRTTSDALLRPLGYQVISSLSEEQQEALEKVRAWLLQDKPEFFCLYGYAGTGKTSLALRIAELVHSAAFVAYTGKAALALRARGCLGATTIHRLIYRAVPTPDFKVQFVLRNPEELTVGLIIVDECSMVDEDLAADLLSFGRPILAMGDPHQLPPIQGESFFQSWRANVYLREVHRQAADNPILRASATLRAGHTLGLRAHPERS